METTTIFVAVIACLFVVAFYSAFQHTRRYSGFETKALNSVSGKLMRINDEFKKTGGPKQVRPLVTIVSLLEGVSKQSIIVDRLEVIKRMRESQVKVSVSALQEMTLARESSAKSLSLPAYAASLSMMIGLLGTVVGLAIMVQQIDLGLPADQSQVTMDSWMESIVHIRGVLGGMKTAFSATMAGIGASILLSFMNHRLSLAQSTFLDKLDRFTTEHLLPATVPATEDDSLFEKVSSQLENSFSRLDDIGKKNQDALIELTGLQKGFVEIVGMIRQSTKTEASERLQGLIGQISGVVHQIVDLNKSVATVTETLPAIVKQVGQSNSESIARIDRLIRLYEQQRGLTQWPMQVKVVFGFLVALNGFLIGKVLLK